MKTIYYVSGGCGSGKTEAAITYMLHLCRTSGKNVLLVQPTKFLLEQTSKRIRQRHPDQNVVLIHGENGDDDVSVKARIMAFMRGHHRRVILGITHAAFLGMKSWHRDGDWHLIMDEIPAADGTFQLNVPDTFRWFIDDFEIESGHGAYFRMSRAVGHQRRFDDVAANKERDDLLAVLHDLYAKVSSKAHDVWVRRDCWNRLGKQRLDGQGRHGALICHWALRPEVFETWDRPTIMGANFTSSMLYLLWQDKVEFAPHPHIKPKFEHYPRETGERLTLHYISERRNSVSLQARLDKRFHTAVNDAISKHWGTEPFLWVGNNAKGGDFIVSKAGTRIPAICHGRNDCVKHTRIAIFAALNDTPPHFKFLEVELGIQADVVHQAKSQEVIHQAIMRTALRDAASSKRVEVLVVDKETALQLKARLFPAARIEGPDEIDPAFIERDMKARERARTKLALTPVERNAKAREAKKRLQDQQLRLSLLLAGGHKTLCVGPSQTHDRCYDYDLNNIVDFVTPGISASFVSTKTSPYVLNEHITNWNEVHALLRDAFAHAYKAKDDNLLMSGAKYDPWLSPDTRRGLANVEYVTFMQLDFDGDDLGVDELHEVLDDFAWLAFNSFNNDLGEGQLRYRVFIPFRHPVTADYYHRLWDALAARIEQYGFTIGRRVPGKPFSGLDKSKRPANSIFYMPSQARRDHRRNSFFDDSQWDEADILDPLAWLDVLDFAPAEEREALVFDKSPELRGLQGALLAQRANRDEEEISDALADMRSACISAAPGTGNTTLFAQAAKMKRLGISESDRERLLQSLAQLMRNPNERRAQIPSIQKSLRRAA